MRWVLAALALIFLFVASPAFAVTYYVGVAGCSDGNSPATAQNPATPWCSITHSSTVVAPGDIVMIKDGTYTEGGMTLSTSGTAINPITYQAQNPCNGSSCTAILNSTVACNPAIGVTASFITLRGFEITGSGITCASGYSSKNDAIRQWGVANAINNPTIPSAGCQVSNFPSCNTPNTTWTNFVIDNLYIPDNNAFDYPVKINSDNSEMKNCLTYGPIDIFDNTGTTIHNNQIHSGSINTGNRIAVNDQMLQVKGGVRDFQVYDNIWYETNDGQIGIDLGGGSQTYSVDNSGNVNSPPINGQKPGLWWDNDAHIECYNCIAYNNIFLDQTADAHGTSFTLQGCNNCGFYNNTTTGDVQVSYILGCESTNCYSISGTNFIANGGARPAPLNPTFINNIFYGNGLTYTSGFFGSLDTSATSACNGSGCSGTQTFDHNIMYNYAVASGLGTHPYPNFATNISTSNPNFVNPISNWHLQTGSPGINAGSSQSPATYAGGNFNIATDFSGVARGASPWDYGVYKTNSAIPPHDWYVDNSVGSSGDGTSWLTAWKDMANIVWGVGGVLPGDTVHISGGATSQTYTNQLSPAAGGSLGSPITITAGADPGHNGQVIFDGAVNPGFFPIQIATGINDMIIQNMTVQNSGDAGILVNATSADTTIIQNMTIHTGVGPTNGTAWGMRFQNNTGAVMALNNTIDTPASSVSGASLAGFNLQNNTGLVTISGNNIFENNSSSCIGGGGQGCDCFSLFKTGNTTINNNYCSHVNGGTNNLGFNIDSMITGSNLLAYNNVVYMPVGNADSSFFQMSSGGFTGTFTFYNNSIYASGTSNLMEITTTGAILKNNIFYQASTGTDIKTTAALTSNFNLLFAPSGNIGNISGVNKTFATWQAAGNDANGVNADPKFVSIANLASGFAIQATSPAINAGTNLAQVAADYNGIIRPQGAFYDIGAFERVIGKTTNCYTAGASISVPADWNSTNNTIEVIGGGSSTPTVQAGFQGTGGGGAGAYSKSVNIALTPSATVNMVVGAAGVTGSTGTGGGDTWFCNAAINCATIGGTAVVAGAKGGALPTGTGSITGGVGGVGASGVASGTGFIKNSGGSGGNGSAFVAPGGGGGAGGPDGSGAVGGTGQTGFSGGPGGGGSDGGTAGANGTAAGGNGGNNFAGLGGGAGNASGSGANGTVGGGGGGGYNPQSASTSGGGGNGGSGNLWTCSSINGGSGGILGPGGGGGGSGGNSSTNPIGVPGAGANYGGGAGASGNTQSGVFNSPGANGGGGLIVLSYSPSLTGTVGASSGELMRGYGN